MLYILEKDHNKLLWLQTSKMMIVVEVIYIANAIYDVYNPCLDYNTIQYNTIG